MKNIYISFIDEIPTMSLDPHEICEPEPLESEEIVAMWSALKYAYEKVLQEIKEKKRVFHRFIQKL